MGCDIHCTWEVRRTQSGPWENMDTWDDGYPARPILDDRNYSLFAMLAGVRNMDDIVPIAEPRGLPSDMAPETEAYFGSYRAGNHSASWLDLEDLCAYDYTQLVRLDREVSALSFYRWESRGRKRGESPPSSSYWVGGDIKHLTEDEMRSYFAELAAGIDPAVTAKWHAVEQLLEAEPRRYYCRVQWDQPYYARAGELFSSAMPQMIKRDGRWGARLIFNFDN